MSEPAPTVPEPAPTKPAATPPAEAAFLAPKVGGPERVYTRALWALLLLTTAFKFVFLTKTWGTSDCDNWFFFARHAMKWGLCDAYNSIGPIFNHPPLATAIETASVACGKWLGTVLGMGPDRYPWSPFFWVRLPALVAEVAGLLLLAPLLQARVGAVQARRILAALMVSPLTLAVGVWHGNTDLIWSVVLLAAALALEWPESVRFTFRIGKGPEVPGPAGRAFAAGLLVGIATGIKFPAIVALAPFGIVAERERRGGAFALGFLASALPLYGWGLLGGGYPFINCVIGYRGTLTAVPWPPGRAFAPLFGPDALTWFLLHGHLFVALAASSVALAWARRGRPGDALAAVYIAVLLVLPVFGTQYLAWLALPIVLLDWRGALLFHLAAFLEAMVVYVYPITKFMTEEEKATALSVGPSLSTWVVLVGVLALALRARDRA